MGEEEVGGVRRWGRRRWVRMSREDDGRGNGRRGMDERKMRWGRRRWEE